MGATFERKINGPPVSTYCTIPGTQNMCQKSWQGSYYDNVPGSSGDAVEERAQSAPPMEIEDNFDNLVLKMDDALKEDLTNKGIPRDIQNELLFHGCNDRKSFAYAIDPFRIPQIIHHSNPYRLEHHKNRWASILNLYLNEVKSAIAQEETLASAKRKDDAKNKKCSEERLEALMTNFTDKTNRIVLTYVRPSAELIGLIESNFRMGKFQFVYAGMIRNVPDSDTYETETKKKEHHKKHSSCLLQRIETLINAFLLLSYENAPANFKEDDLVLNVR